MLIQERNHLWLNGFVFVISTWIVRLLEVTVHLGCSDTKEYCFTSYIPKVKSCKFLRVRGTIKYRIAFIIFSLQCFFFNVTSSWKFHEEQKAQKNRSDCAWVSRAPAEIRILFLCHAFSWLLQRLHFEKPFLLSGTICITTNTNCSAG